MKTTLVTLALVGLTSGAMAQTSMAPMMMATIAASSAIQANMAANRAANTVGLGALEGKQIENCLVLAAFYQEGDVQVICLNKIKDEVYRVPVYKVKGAFSKGVFDELRKQFNTEDKDDKK